MEIRNDSGELINHFELDEQYLAKHFVNKNDMIDKLRSVKFLLPIGKKGGWFYWQRLTGIIPLSINFEIVPPAPSSPSSVWGARTKTFLKLFIIRCKLNFYIFQKFICNTKNN